jgi:hypothetical protein
MAYERIADDPGYAHFGEISAFFVVTRLRAAHVL